MTRKLSIAAGGCALLVVIGLVYATTSGPGSAKSRTESSTAQPVAKFEATPASGIAPLHVQFTDVSTGSPTKWVWNFGDGSTATGHAPSHVYARAGKYTVSLVVTNAAGTNALTETNAVTVSAPSTPDWTTIVDDQFNTPGLPSHWLVYSGSYAGDPASCASPGQVQVPGDGYLHLIMEYQTSGICGRAWYTGGMQIAQAYGGIDQAITLRWRIVPSKDPGVVRSTRVIPMHWVDDPKYAWYQGEADYCEGHSLGGCYIYLHYGPNYTQIVHRLSVDLTQWHTFRIEQRNHQVSVFIDDMSKPVWVYKGNATTVPNAFTRAVLQQMCSLSSGCPPASYAGDEEDIQIDWITIQNAVETGNAQAATPTADFILGTPSTKTNAAPIAIVTPLKTVDLLNALTSSEPRRSLLSAAI